MKKYVALALLAAAGAAHADTVDVNVTGWQTFGGYLAPGNGFANIALPAGTQITGVEWIDLSFTALGASWRSEMTLSVNDDTAAAQYWDHAPDIANSSPGSYGPASGVFSDPGNVFGGSFTMATNNLYITVYETFNDGGDATQDAQISAGTLRVTYTPVPAPASVALMGLGGLVAARRRRA